MTEVVLKSISYPRSILDLVKRDQAEECYIERAEQSAAVHQDALKEARAHVGDNGADEFGSMEPTASRRELFEQKSVHTDRKGRSRDKAAAKRAKAIERSKPKLPKELHTLLYNGAVLHNIGGYKLTRGQRLKLKQNKLLAGTAKLKRQLESQLA